MILTRAEATNYAETSSYTDVLAFLDQLKTIRRSVLGTSIEGREIPLATLGSGALKVYIQANIHAGEVEGKEAALMLLRDCPKRLLEKLTLIVAPIYNADGNEKWGEGRRNRPSQDGPARVGVRPNGQGLDLNRDCIKAESPEMRGALKNVYGALDPDVVFDLHTTNGTRHGWSLTYAPPTHPNTPEAILAYSRDSLLPEVRKRLRKSRGWDLFDYGNAEQRDKGRVWATFGAEGRYVTNYAGLRGSVAILSEAVSFLPFRFRVESTYRFVLETLELLARDGESIRRMRAAMRMPGELGVRFEMVSRGVESVPLERPRPESEIDHTKAPTALERVKMPIYDRWKPTKTAQVPKFYGIPGELHEAVALLRRHGIVLEPLRSVWKGVAEVFTVAERVAAREFQGHRLLRLEGRWGPRQEVRLTPGSFLAPTDQPLGRLLFHLLEPECLDGLAAWNFLDDALSPDQPYPIIKLL